MDKLQELYHDLTGIDLSEQQKLWDERGKGYYGEYLLFKLLFPNLDGCCKILMNLQIPTANGKTTEIDLLLIHENGLYVFEAKHYKGTIYGSENQPRWTQYFRTTKNAYFTNPVKQNQYHIIALKKLFPNVPLHSVIVFTNPECDLRVNCQSSNVTVCKLNYLRTLFSTFNSSETIIGAEEIDTIFNKLSDFSPITQNIVTVNETELPFYDYIHKIIHDYKETKKTLENTYCNKFKKLQKDKIKIIISAIVTCILCIVLSCSACDEYRKIANKQVELAQNELATFAQKFEQVKFPNNEDLSFTNNLVSISDLSIKPSKEINNTTVVQFKINHTGSNYGICINSESSIILILKDGSVSECKIFNEKYPFTDNVYVGSKSSCSILPHEFYNISVDDIRYAKLSNIDVWTNANSKKEIVFSGYEIELFSAN